jgi:glycosyltransferase involved in cell wall biosynthesis
MYGGVESFLVTLARLRDLCPEMEPTFGLCFADRLHDELSALGVPVRILGEARLSRPWTVWKARRRLWEVLNRERFDVVVCHGCWVHVLFGPVVRRQKTSLVFWTHDTPTGQHWLEWLARRTNPDLVIANSQFTQSALGNLFAKARSEVVYCPVAAPTIADSNLARRQVRQSLQAAEDATVIIQVSRLERWKGVHILLESLGHLTDLPGWVCWIAGGAQKLPEHDYLEELRQKISLLGLARRVQFLGQRADVPRLLAAADIHCQPNTGPEPFGIAFVEALYAGLPVVTTAIGGATEIVDGSVGKLVGQADPELLAVALDQLIRDGTVRKRLGGAGPARARQLCNPDRQIRRIHELLDDLVRRAAA